MIHRLKNIKIMIYIDKHWWSPSFKNRFGLEKEQNFRNKVINQAEIN